MSDFSIVKRRILEYLEYKGVSKYEFYKASTVSNGVLSQKSGMSEENILKTLSHYRDINPSWLMIGEGEMLHSSEKLSGEMKVATGVTGVGSEEIQELKLKIQQLSEENIKLSAQLEFCERQLDKKVNNSQSNDDAEQRHVS